MLNYLAGRTQSIRLGTSVLILPMRKPIEVAAQVAELDRVSRGRLNFGVGVGWFEDEYDALGYSFKTRGRRANDGLAICRKLWSGEPTSHKSPFHSFSGAVLGPTPAQNPHPPIWLAGGGSIETWEFAAQNDYTYSYLSFGGRKAAQGLMDGFWEVMDKHGYDRNPYRAGFAQIV